MDPEKAWIVILLGVGGAVALPIVLYLAFRNSNAGIQWNLLKKASSRSTKPWVTEEQSLAELRRRVAELQKRQTLQGQPEEQPNEDKNSGR